MRLKRSVLGSQTLATAAVARCGARRRPAQRAQQRIAAAGGNDPAAPDGNRGIGVMTEILAKAMFEIVSSSRKASYPLGAR